MSAAHHAEPPPAPSREQSAAIAARDRDVFLEAGAGSGKTRVLVERYCAAVGDDDVAVDRILAFTFTERAAAELRSRVRAGLIERAGAAADPHEAAELARSARDTERAWITTIHGFCRRLLAAHPAAAGLDPRFRVLDEAEAGRLAERAFTDALEGLVAAGEKRVVQLAAGYRADHLGEMVRAAHDRLRTQGCEPPRLPDPGDPIRSRRKDDEPELSAEQARMAREGHEALAALLDAYHRRYDELKAGRSAVDFEDLELRALELLRAEGPVREAWRERFDHLMVDEFQDTNRVQLALVDALHGPATHLFTVGDEFQSIYRFRHADLAVFRRRRADSEADDSVETLPLRGNHRSRPEVIAAVDFLGETLMDGFQPLASGRDPVPGGEPAVELVLTDVSDDVAGKPEGWRDPGVELDAPPSETNPASVAEARGLAQRLRELTDGPAGVARGDIVVLLRAFTHVDAFEDALTRAGLEPYVVGGRGYWSQQQVEDLLRLLSAIANPLDDEMLLGALASPACAVSADTLWLLRTGAGKGRHLWPVVEQRFGTAGRAGDGPEAAEAPDPDATDEESEGPSTPLDAAAVDAIDPADAERLERFCGILARLRAAAPLLSLDALIEEAMNAFDYDLAMLALPQGRLRMANVRKLMRLAGEYEEHEGRDLRGFLDVAEQRTARDAREGLAALQVEGHDGVRVMTVHAAKGLEFPVVAVADLGRRLSAGASAQNVVIGPLEREIGTTDGARFGMRLGLPGAESLRLWELVALEEEDRLADAEEGCRLAYVAATRARERLILSGTFRQGQLEPAEPRPSDTVLHRLLPALAERGWDGDDGAVSIEAPLGIDGGAVECEPRLEISVQRPSPERAAGLRRTFERSSPEAAEPARAERPLLAELAAAQAVGHLSYSALADFDRCAYRFYAERVLGLRAADLDGPEPTDADGDEQAPDAPDELVEPSSGPRELRLATGNAVHAALEWSARQGWREPGEAELEAILTRAGLDAEPGAPERVRALVAAWLGSPLRAELEGSAARLRPEVPFAIELGGTIVRGKIDLLADGDRGPLVVDYKTDELSGSDPVELAERYETQRDLYALAAARAAGRDGIEVRAAYCFLERPDRIAIETYDAARLTAAATRLEGLIKRIREGDFRRTESPYPALCYGCPAAAHLCGKPAWQPPRPGGADANGAEPAEPTGGEPPEPVQLTLDSLDR